MLQVYSQLKQNGYIIAHAQAKFKCPQPFDPSILKLPPPHAFEAWKPRPHFKLSQPPPPDFRIFIESEKESALIVPKIIPEGPGSAILALSDQGLPVFYEIQMLGSNFTPNTTEKSLPKYSTINVSD
ncbi:hypothetical protein HMI55_001379 [Coelomomyces lativittatus]|nr:hypothetical protein HMI55_001379 [Coelomomyces lativittatus]